MPDSNSDRLAALRSGVSTRPQQAQTVYLPKPATTLTYAQRLALRAAQAQAQPAAQAQAAASAQTPAAQAQAPAASAPPKRTWSTYHCCVCATDFKEDTTDCPDPRPSPLGDRCPSCKAAGAQRPFEAAGMTLSKMMTALAVCRFCQGSHWAMDCPTKK